MSALLYNLKVATEELGLPEDIIIEFIGDFVQQAYDFKYKIYEGLTENGEIKNFYSLVEKLYGVAKNLRISTVCETLKIIESSTHKAEVMQSLEIFCAQIDELKNKNLVNELYIKTEKAIDDDYLVLDLPEDLDENIASLLRKQGKLYETAKQADKVIETYIELIKVTEVLSQKNPDENLEMYIHSFRLLGLAYYKQKQFFDCINTMDKAYAITKELCEQQHLKWGNLHLSNISLLTSAYTSFHMPEKAALLKQEAAQISTNFSE